MAELDEFFACLEDQPSYESLKLELENAQRAYEELLNECSENFEACGELEEKINANNLHIAKLERKDQNQSRMLKTCQQNNMDLHDQFDQVSAKYSRLKIQAKARIKSLSASNKKLRDQIELFERQKQFAVNTIHKMKDARKPTEELIALKEEMDELQNKTASLYEEINRQGMQLEEYRAKIIQQSTNLNICREEKAWLHDQYDKYVLQSVQRTEERDLAQAELAKLQQKHLLQSEKVDKLKSRKRELTTIYQQLDNEHKDLLDHHEEMRNRNNQLIKALEECAAEKNIVATNYSTVLFNEEYNKKRIDELNMAYDRLKSEHEQLITSSNACAAEKHGLREELSSVQQQLAHKEEDMQTVLAELGRYKELVAYSDQIRVSRDDPIRLKRQRDEEVQKRATLEVELQAAQDRITALEHSFSEAKIPDFELYKDWTNALLKKKDDDYRQISVLRTREIFQGNDAESERDRIKLVYGALQDMHEKLQKECDSLSEKFNSLQTENDELKAMIREYKQSGVLGMLRGFGAT